MFNQRIRFNSNVAIDFALKIILSTTLICLLAPISFDINEELSTTLQTLVILLGACAFGMRIGFISALLYIIIGALGAPIFSESASGIDVVLGAHGGFFFGFLAAAAVAGFLSERSEPKKFVQNLGIWMLAHLIILVLGFGWMTSIIPNIPLGKTLEPLIPGLFIKIAIGILVLHIIGRFVDRHEQREAKL